MGLEANCSCSWSGGSGDVKATLEPGALILRGNVRLTIELTSIVEARAEGEDLHLRVKDGDLALSLGVGTAERWLRRLSTPPPSLAHKLGIGSQSRALLIGDIDDPDVAKSLRDALTADFGEAALSVAFVSDEAGLITALERHRDLPGKPIWVVHGKGRSAHIGEQPTRVFMRAAGYTDTKVSAVSDTRSATRYTPTRG